MKVVLDTSVIIAAFAARGLCHAVFELCLDRHELFFSDFILDEVEKNLTKKIKLPHTVTKETLIYMQENSTIVTPTPVSAKLCRDPNDLPILGTAIAAIAEFLVSVDKDLLVMKQIEKTAIISPRQFWEISTKL